MEGRLEFTITSKTKAKAKKRRIKNESKWVTLRIISIVSLAISSVSGIAGIFFVPYEKYTLAGILGVLFSVCLVLFFVCRSLISNMSSHWIEDRLNERIWVEGGRLYQLIQMNFAGGLNYRSADERAALYIVDIDTIHNAKHDPKSGRIEFNAFGEGVFYSDYQTGAVRERWELKEDFVGIFYDYTEPSLYEYLKSVGVKFSEETIQFRIRDARI
jgi:hypothetical protein